MGSRTDANIAAWQRAAGIESATGMRAEILRQLSEAAFDAIKIIELERSGGIRDGDGHWYGSDVIGHMTGNLIELYERLMQSYRERNTHDGGPLDDEATIKALAREPDELDEIL